MAPETLDSNVYNEKTDMYAFGMCLLELLTRKSPYSECSNTREFLSKVLNVSWSVFDNDIGYLTWFIERSNWSFIQWIDSYPIRSSFKSSFCKWIIGMSLLKSENVSRRESIRSPQYDDSPPVLTCFEECDENEFTPVTNYCKVCKKWWIWFSYPSPLMKMKDQRVKILWLYPYYPSKVTYFDWVSFVGIVILFLSVE